MTAGGEIRHLALREFHESAGAVFAPSHGWSLPRHYGDPGAEHAAIRTSAAAFDASAESRFIVSGTDAEDVLAGAFGEGVRDLEEGRAARALALAREGTIEDAALVARTGGIAYTVTGHPLRRFATLARLEAAAETGFDARIDDRTDSTCLIGVTGPAAAEAIAAHVTPSLPPRLPALHAVAFEFHGFRALAIRTSESGEDGFAFVLAPAVALHLLETLTDAGITLGGRDALETARVEAGIPAAVPDLEGLTAAQAELGALAGSPRDDPDRLLAAVLIEGDAIPRSGTALHAETLDAGELRSAVRSRSLDGIAGFAVLDQAYATPGTVLRVEETSAVVVQKPIYRRRSS